jgi:hypothetical protein
MRRWPKEEGPQHATPVTPRETKRWGWLLSLFLNRLLRSGFLTLHLPILHDIVKTGLSWDPPIARPYTSTATPSHADWLRHYSLARTSRVFYYSSVNHIWRSEWLRSPVWRYHRQLTHWSKSKNIPQRRPQKGPWYNAQAVAQKRLLTLF